MSHSHRRSPWAVFGYGIVAGVSLLAGVNAWRRVQRDDDELAPFGCG